MKHLNLGRVKPLLAGRRLTRTAMLIGLAGATAGSLMLGAVTAQAASDPVGTDPTTGTLTFTDATTNLPVTSGPGRELLKWNTSDACPSATSGSAIVASFDPDTNKQDSLASLPASGPGPYAGTEMDATVANLWASYTDNSSPTFELAVVCSAGSGGSEQSAFVYYQYAYVTYNQGANTFTISPTNTGPAKTGTTTTLTAKDLTTTSEPGGTAQAGDSVQFTATVTDADSTTPAGSVDFQENGTDIGTEPVTVAALSGGGFGAQVTTTFSAASNYPITATFTPSDTTTYAGSSGSLTETVTPVGATTATVPENLTVPDQGTFTVTVDTTPIQLVVPGGNGSDALGDFGVQSPAAPNTGTSTAGVEVTDTRNYYPGWYVTGQTGNFSGVSGTPTANTTIPGNQLGWTPNTGETWATSGPAQATIGALVSPAPAGAGLGTTAATLASAPAGGGVGTYDVSALLDLKIPNGTFAGGYTSTLTITAVSSAP
jgi:hypothetical protein